MGCHPCVSSLLWGSVVVGVWSAGVVLGVGPSGICAGDPRHEALAYQHQLQRKEPFKFMAPPKLFRALHGQPFRAARAAFSKSRFIAVKDSVTEYIKEKERNGTLQEIARGRSSSERVRVATLIFTPLLNGAGLALRSVRSLIDGTGAVVVVNDWCQFVITLESREERRVRESSPGRGNLPKRSILLETRDQNESTMYATARVLGEKHSDIVGSGAKLVTGGRVYDKLSLDYTLNQTLFFYGTYENFKMMIFDRASLSSVHHRRPWLVLPNEYRSEDSITFKFPPPAENLAETAVAQAVEAIKEYNEISILTRKRHRVRSPSRNSILRQRLRLPPPPPPPSRRTAQRNIG